MPMTGEQESALSQMQKATHQDKKIPFLINIVDARLMPNVPNIANSADYRPYRGDPKASLEERQRYVASVSAARRIINTAVDEAEAEPIDVAKMDKTALIAFAFDEFGVVLSPDMTLKLMRQKVMEAAANPVPVPTKIESDPDLSE